MSIAQNDQQLKTCSQTKYILFWFLHDTCAFYYFIYSEIDHNDVWHMVTQEYLINYDCVTLFSLQTVPYIGSKNCHIYSLNLVYNM